MATTHDETIAELHRANVELRQSLGAALARESALAQVLDVINRSPGDPVPVFEAILDKAHQLCGAAAGSLMAYDGTYVHARATRGFPEEHEALLRQPFRLQPFGGLSARQSIHVEQPKTFEAGLERLIHGGRLFQIVDFKTFEAQPDSEVNRSTIERTNVRSCVTVPLRRDGAFLGYISAFRLEVRPFSEAEVALLEGFAAQAVIAMENARLITEQREALEQQTATAEVLQVINASPGNLATVFDAMLQRATRLCGTAIGSFWSHNGETFQVLASTIGDAGRTMQPGPDTALWRITHGESVVQIADVEAEPAYRVDAAGQMRTRLAGTRTALAVALRKDETLVGAITTGRPEVRPFTDRQIALLQNFAAQAVIAMENARLITETREALEQQTATAEVLGAINASPGNLKPVFDAMLEKAMWLCGGTIGSISTYDGERFQPATMRGTTAAFAEYNEKYSRPVPIPGTAPAKVIETRRSIQVPDITAGEPYRNGVPYARALVELGDIRAVLNVPLIKDNVVIGIITIYRREIGAFSDRQIALLENFAAQAVIAIENARLLTEQQEALEQQTATAEVLQVINASPGNLTPVFEAMLDKAMRLCGAVIGGIYSYDGQWFVPVALRGVTPAFAAFSAEHPVPSGPRSAPTLILETKRPVQIPDLADASVYTRGMVDLGGIRALLDVPLLKEGTVLGFIAIYREKAGAFSDKEIALLENFAAQAVIAMENARLINEQREALEQQTATAEVLQVINASPGNLVPVFEAILEKAHRLCGAVIGSLLVYDGEYFHAAATHDLPQQMALFVRQPFPPNRFLNELLRGERIQHISHIRTAEADQDHELTQSTIEEAGVRTSLWVPLRKDGTLLGCITAFRMEVHPFSEREITLLESFAAQAVIAMENARLITEQREALEQQTATAEMLAVINASPGDLAPVFDAVLEKAHRLCRVAHGALVLRDGETFRAVATHSYPGTFGEQLRQGYRGADNMITRSLIAGARFVHLPDLAQIDDPIIRASVEVAGVRTGLYVPLRKDGVLLGMISSARREVRPFSDKEIALVENFAAQAVIAIENARLLDEIRRRQEELRVTFENMGDGVAMFDGTPRLVAWNQKFQDILDVPDDAVSERPTLDEYIHYLTERGEFGRNADLNEQVSRLQATRDQSAVFERTRPNGRIIEVRNNPVAGGGFVLIYADITERKRNEVAIRAARDAAEEASRTIEAAYRDLKAAQANLIQAEKMASLGQLTAGIAHEIKNPLNFVNNFSALSAELIDELREVLTPQPLGDTVRREVDDLTALLKGNLEKVVQHGQRADNIVKAMLEHSRGSSAERRMVDLNAAIDEALNLAYHGARAQDQSFNITLERDFDAGIAPIEVNPQDMTRVFLNIFSNGFYAATRRAGGRDADFVPKLKVTTRDVGEAVEIRVRDNGTGISAEIRDKLFQPFFTTKPSGEGTGLGLSITYDVVTKQHGGTITVDSEVDVFTEFVVTLPRRMFATEGDRA